MSTKTNKTYTIMKDGIKIKTAKSLNAAKAIADQEQAEVFCGEECVYKAQITATGETEVTEAVEATEVSQTAEATEEVKAVETVHAVQSSETQSDVSDNAVEANPAANTASSVSDMAGAKTDMAEKPTVRSAAIEEEPRLGISIHNAPQPKYENFRLTALMNVRAEASMSAKVLRTAPAGTVVQVSHIENNWMKIRNGSDFAYILYEKDGKKFAERVGA